MLITRISNRLASKEGFVRSVLILVGGTASAHAITALALPILTRLYSPSDFSVLAVFSSMLAIVSVAACLRFDIAIPLPEHGDKAFALVVLALLGAVCVAAVTAIAVLNAPSWIAGKVGRPELEPFLPWLPLGILMAGTYSAIQNWFVRERHFSLIARSRVVQAGASAGAQVGIGLVGSGPFGLVLGYLLNTGAACVGLGYRFFRAEARSRGRVGFRFGLLRETFLEYSRYPKYSTLEALCNSASVQVPIVMIAALSTGQEPGYLLLAMSVIQAPMALFGTAIGQVYLSQAPKEFREGRLGNFTIDVLAGLVRTGVGPLVTVAIVSPFAFAVVFGREWERAGWLVAWMSPWFIMQFLAAPLSMAIHVVGRQRLAFSLQVFGLAVRVLAVLAGAKLPNTPVSEFYAASGALFYTLYFILILRAVKVERGGLRRVASGSAAVVLAWTAGGAVLAVLAQMLLSNRLAG